MTKLTPKGMRDILPEDAILRRDVLQTVEQVYRKYGFVPLETPAMEYMATLRAKAGEEIDKQIFVLKDEELGLRFDLTVPMARVVATNTFPKPFKRYAFAPVWRYEEPQKGRFREFWQADIDTVGSKSMRAEAEVLAAARDALQALGFRELRILINNRKVLDAVVARLKIEDKKAAVFRLLDKIDKVGPIRVREELEQVIGKPRTMEFLQVLDTKGDNEAKLKAIEKVSPEGAEELKQVLALCPFPIEIDLSLVRGLGYYTGPIFEIKGGESIGSIAGGGRYDNLLSVYGQGDPAVGISLGIERIIVLLKERKAREQTSVQTYTQALVAAVKPEFYPKALETARTLRERGIAAETDLNERNLRKQFDYANALGIPYVIILGEKEIQSGKVTLRNMREGTEEALPPEEAIARLQEE